MVDKAAALKCLLERGRGFRRGRAASRTAARRARASPPEAAAHEVLSGAEVEGVDDHAVEHAAQRCGKRAREVGETVTAMDRAYC